ncbi:uncharacterized protein [Heptranchias perlo]|uniref:uncharacterized protein n=1 Tax=Heptranchias perlo TaxID=212740 RepID=UPI00355A6D70
MSFWCGVLFVVTATFSLNALYHDLFVSGPLDIVVPKRLLGSLYQPVRNGAAPKDYSTDLISQSEFKIHHPFTALLPIKEAFEFQFEVPEEESIMETDLEPPAETGLSVIETGLSVIETGLSVIETGLSVVETIKIESIWNEDSQEDMIISDELSGETFQTCLAVDAASIKTEPVVKEESQKPVSQVISLGEYRDTSAKHESVTSTEKEFHKDHPALNSDPLQHHLEPDVIIVLAAHLTLVVSVLVIGCRCLCVQKQSINSSVDVEELIVTVGLISCIAAALFALLGATIILFIRILLAKFP